MPYAVMRPSPSISLINTSTSTLTSRICLMMKFSPLCRKETTRPKIHPRVIPLVREIHSHSRPEISKKGGLQVAKQRRIAVLQKSEQQTMIGSHGKLSHKQYRKKADEIAKEIHKGTTPRPAFTRHPEEPDSTIYGQRRVYPLTRENFIRLAGLSEELGDFVDLPPEFRKATS